MCMNIFTKNHWKIKRLFIKIKMLLFPTLHQELTNHIVNESMKSPIYSGTKDYRDLISRISTELKKGKKVITVIDGTMVELSECNGKLSSEKVRPNKLHQKLS